MVSSCICPLLKQQCVQLIQYKPNLSFSFLWKKYPLCCWNSDARSIKVPNIENKLWVLFFCCSMTFIHDIIGFMLTQINIYVAKRTSNSPGCTFMTLPSLSSFVGSKAEIMWFHFRYNQGRNGSEWLFGTLGQLSSFSLFFYWFVFPPPTPFLHKIYFSLKIFVTGYHKFPWRRNRVVAILVCDLEASDSLPAQRHKGHGSKAQRRKVAICSKALNAYVNQ